MRTVIVPMQLLLAVVLAFSPSWLTAQPLRPRAGTTLELAPANGESTDKTGSVTFIGTATVLIRYHGFTILTDPNYLHKGEHVHLGYGLRAKRLTDPALKLEQLPRIDLVILSHLHEDHFDRRVQQQLARDTPILTTVEGAAELRQMGFDKAMGIATWEKLDLRRGNARLTISAVPGRHGPVGVNALLPSIMGSMLEFAPLPGSPGYRMYISGDTLVHDDIALIPHRFPGIDLALLHLGGTRILRMVKVTMDGKDGVQMLQIIAPAHAIPIHYNDYDVFRSPLSEFEQAVKAAGLADKITYLKHGDSYQFGAAGSGAD